MTSSNLKNYGSLMRIKDWIPSFLMALLGFEFSKGYFQSTMGSILFLTLVALYLGFSFSINLCSDVKEDRLNPLKKNPIASGKVSSKNAQLFSALLGFSGVIISSYFGSMALIFFTTMAIMALYYSAPPIRLKSRLYLDLFSHGLFFGSMLFLLPFFLFGSQITALDWVITISVFYASVMLEFANHMQDYKWDKKAGIKTTVTDIGVATSKKIAKGMAITFPLFFLVMSLYLNNFLIFLPTLIYYPLLYFKPSIYSKDNYRFLGVYVTLCYAITVFVFLTQ
jgi:4-hydroxybenzoate polyprenyltransferase